MSTRPPADPLAAARRFALDGEPAKAAPLGRGHIHDTFEVRVRGGRGPQGYCLQRLNRHVFRDLDAVMENVQRVTEHLRGKVAARGGDPARETLHLLPTRDGRIWLDDPELGCWRAFHLVEGTRVVDRPEHPGQVYEAARAFARFTRDLADLPGGRLRETIPRFHDTPQRLGDLRAAVEEDSRGRLETCREEVEVVEARAGEVDRVVRGLASGELPEHVTHNDTKLNNVLLDQESGEGVCVIDLDTVMPGSVLYDFGDAVRVGAAAAPEDCRELERVRVSMVHFEALARGWVLESGDFLAASERALMPFSCRLLTLEVGMRFLTDYLQGDPYFKTLRPAHNLDRARAQLRLVACIEEHLDDMAEVVERAAGEVG